MALWLATLNGQGLWSESRIWNRVHLAVNACCLQEIHLIASDYKDILSKWFRLYSAYFDSRFRGVSWLIRRPLTASCAHVFADSEGRICVLDITIKGKSLRFIGFMRPTTRRSEWPFFGKSSFFFF